MNVNGITHTYASCKVIDFAGEKDVVEAHKHWRESNLDRAGDGRKKAIKGTCVCRHG